MIEKYSDKYNLNKLKLDEPKAYSLKRYPYEPLRHAVKYRRDKLKPAKTIAWQKVGNSVILTLQEVTFDM